jgi:hypothetical protein
MRDLFIGTWTLNLQRSLFDPNHRPTSGTLVFERDHQGRVARWSVVHEMKAMPAALKSWTGR